MTTTIEFIDGDPPAIARKGRIGIVDTFLPDLKANPGRWAIVKRYRAGASTGSPTNTVKSFKRRGCEVITRLDPATGERVVYARWPADSPDAPVATVARIGTTADRKTADVYLQAVAEGRSGVLAIKSAFGLSEPEAKAAIVGARKAGLIPSPKAAG